MKTILFNTQANIPIGNIRNGRYLVDGQIPELPEYVKELTVEYSQHEYDPLTQKASQYWDADLIEMKWKQVWVIEDLSEFELALINWKYPEWAKRIVAPISLALDDVGAKMYVWFQLNRFPIDTVGTNVHLYCNVVLPQHQTIIDALGETISVEDRPDILSPGNPEE